MRNEEFPFSSLPPSGGGFAGCRGGFQTRPCGISRRDRLVWVGAHLCVRPVWDEQRADTQVSPYPLKRDAPGLAPPEGELADCSRD